MRNIASFVVSEDDANVSYLGLERITKNALFAVGTLLAIFRILPFFSHSKTMGPL